MLRGGCTRQPLRLRQSTARIPETGSLQTKKRQAKRGLVPLDAARADQLADECATCRVTARPARNSIRVELTICRLPLSPWNRLAKWAPVLGGMPMARRSSVLSG